MAFMIKLTQSNEINQTKDLEAEKTINAERTEEGLAIRDFYEEDENEYFNKEFNYIRWLVIFFFSYLIILSFSCS